MPPIEWSSIKNYPELLWALHKGTDSEEKATSWSSLLLSFPSRLFSSLFGKGTEGSAPYRGVRTNQPALFAVIIGINQYEDSGSLPPLQGAVPDADAVKQYLVDDLQVPSDRITCLLDGQASRQAIIDAFSKNLMCDARINENDPILVYFAGHGGEVRKDGTETIQVIYAQDSRKDDDTRPPIPDSTIAVLVDDLSRKYGNNITVILDCCHSGSGTRSEESDRTSSIVRGVAPIESLPSNLDQDICGSTRAVNVAHGFTRLGINSHVLLAACSANELAREDGGRGRFTVALLKLLRAVGADKLTYADVLTRMDRILEQNPQCEGNFRSRVFFDAKVPSPIRICHLVAFENDNTSEEDSYILQAGSAHGITPDAEFTIYKSKGAALGEPLGVMKAQEISFFTTALTPLSTAVGLLSPLLEPEEILVAQQTKVGRAEDFRLHIPLEEMNSSIFKAVVGELNATGSNPCRITLGPRKDAQMEMAIDQGLLKLNVLHKLLEHGISRVPHSLGTDIDKNKLKIILCSAAHYSFHLNHTQENSRIETDIGVQFMRLRELRGTYDHNGRLVLMPEEGNLIQNRKINIIPSKEAKYGFELENHTPWNLHFYFFFFNNTDLSITAFNSGSNPGSYIQDTMLPTKGGVATLGYGTLGLQPFECSVSKGLDNEAGFFKIYFATEALDLSHVPQPSPFPDSRTIRQVVQRQSPVWGTILIPVILRRT